MLTSILLSSHIQHFTKFRRLLLLAWSLGANTLSIFFLSECSFVKADPNSDFGQNLLSYYTSDEVAAGSDSRVPTGHFGLFALELDHPESDGPTCALLPYYSLDGFGNQLQVARLSAMASATAGILASLVLVVTIFIMQCCCPVTGMRYILGVMFLVALITQGLTFLAVRDDACNGNEGERCVLGRGAIKAIAAAPLYFFALVQTLLVPFPSQRVLGGGKEESGKEQLADSFDSFDSFNDDGDYNGAGGWINTTASSEDTLRSASLGEMEAEEGAVLAPNEDEAPMPAVKEEEEEEEEESMAFMDEHVDRNGPRGLLEKSPSLVRVEEGDHDYNFFGGGDFKWRRSKDDEEVRLT